MDLKRKHKIFLVDDHPIARQDVAQWIDRAPILAIVGKGKDAYESLRAIKEAKPDVCLMDVSIRARIQMLKEFKRHVPELPVVVLSMHNQLFYAEQALRAGARAYVMRQDAPRVLLSAIRKVLSGDIYINEKMGVMVLQQMVGGRAPAKPSLGLDCLSAREMEIFQLIGAGNSVREIAQKLCLSVKTVEHHREHIMEKLNMKRSAELVRYAARISPDGG